MAIPVPRRGMDAWLFAGNPGFHGVRGAWTSTARRSRSGARDHQNPICRLLVRGGGAPDCAHCLVVEIIAFPVAGTVQQLSVHTIGGVVTPAQALLVVVPGDSHLEIEAMVLNRDIGFVQAGQDAQIKIATFNFSRYGLLHGKVLSVSPDAITHDKPQDKTGNDDTQGAENATSEPKGHELVYAARVSLDHEQMQVDDRLINLSPGMAVTVEIKTGTRRIISYLLSPLVRYTHDSLRER